MPRVSKRGISLRFTIPERGSGKTWGSRRKISLDFTNRITVYF